MGHIENDNFDEVLAKENAETYTKNDEFPKSRLKSTMREHTEGNAVEYSDKFTPAGDL